MLISEISNYTTWVGDIRKTIVREIFKYDTGNDVTSLPLSYLKTSLTIVFLTSPTQVV